VKKREDLGMRVGRNSIMEVKVLEKYAREEKESFLG
jgi:hypothetical protein